MKKVMIKVTNQLYVTHLPLRFIEKVRALLIIKNPKHAENEKMGYSNWKTPRKLRFVNEDTTIMPKGFLRRLKILLKKNNIPYRVVHKTISIPCLPIIKSEINLVDFQDVAVRKVLRKRFCVLQAPTGSGKTVMAIETIARRNERTIIIVHTKELMYQWKERLLEFTDLEEKDIGLLGDGQKSIGLVTIGIINTLQKPTTKKYDIMFGYAIVDECHRAPSSVFSTYLKRLNTKYMLGLSATPYRRDGLTEVIHFYVGDTTHKIDTKHLQKEGHILKANLRVVKTNFTAYVNSVHEYHRVISELTKDVDRNDLITTEVLKQVRKREGIVLVISDRRNHCELLYNRLLEHEFTTLMLLGTTPTKKRKEIVARINAGEAKVVVATAQLIGEGTDIVDLSSILLTTPISGKEGKMGKLIQCIGRILRKAEGKKKATIIDFDDSCWLLKGSFGKRMKTYKEMGVEHVK